MASRFWVGGGSANTWAATSNTNWATTSGGANNATVPGTSDIAIFDSNSGAGNSVIGANITVTGLECDGSSLGTGSYAGTLTHNTGVTLTINTGQANSFRLTSGMTYTPATVTSIVSLTHTSGTANIKCGGQKLFALTINGVGGTTKPLDTTLVNAGQNAILTLTNGIIDFNSGAGGPFAVTAYNISSSNSNTRSLILGGTVTIGGNITNGQTPWNLGTTTGLTFTKNSANIVFAAPSSAIQGTTFAGGSQTYNNLTLNASTSNIALLISGVNTFGTMTVGSGWQLQLLQGSATIVSGFTGTGTQANPILLVSQTNTSVATLSCASGAVTLTWGGLFGITGSGGATFTATDTFNFGTNSGWAITPPADSATTLAANTVTILNATTGAVARGTVTTGGSTTSVPTSALTVNGLAASGVVSNQYVGRTILFDGNTTTAGLQDAASSITASTASNTPTLTVGALPATPASGDTFSII